MKDALGVNFDEMVYIGDNPQKDFFISSLHPVECVRINRADGIHRNHEYLGGHREKYSVENFHQMPDWA